MILSITMAVSSERDSSRVLTSATGTDERRTCTDSFLRSVERRTVYQPLRVIRRPRPRPNVVAFSTAGTKWSLNIGTLHVIEVYLTLVSGVKSAIISFIMSIGKKHTAGEDFDVYWFGSKTAHVRLNTTVRVNMQPRKECEDLTEYAVDLSLKIFEITPLISIPDCSLDADIQSSIANEEEVQDVTLIVGAEELRQEIKANKFMLVARSPVFARMFNTEMKEKENGTVTIPDIRPEVCKEMLSFVYMGKVAKLKSLQLAEELLVAAEKYELLRLKAMCENQIALYLSVSNAAHILAFANVYCGKELKDKVIDFIASDSETCSEIMKTEGWKEVEEQGGALMTEVMSRLVMTDQEPSAKRPRLSS